MANTQPNEASAAQVVSKALTPLNIPASGGTAKVAASPVRQSLSALPSPAVEEEEPMRVRQASWSAYGAKTHLEFLEAMQQLATDQAAQNAEASADEGVRPPPSSSFFCDAA